MTTILCYGDSNTWGCIPLEGTEPAQRFPPDTRWPGVLRRELGERLLDRRGGPQRTHDSVGRPARAAPQWAQAAPPHPPDPPASRSGDHHARDERPQAPHERLGGGDRGGRRDARRHRRRQRLWPRRSRAADSARLPCARSRRSTRSTTRSREGRRSRTGSPEHFAAIAEARSCAFLDAGAFIPSSDVDGIHLDEPRACRAGGRDCRAASGCYSPEPFRACNSLATP